MRFALIHNPRSRLNIGDRDGFETTAARRLGGGFVKASDAATLREAMDDFARRSVETIAISGGDGTISHVLTAIARVYPHDHLPKVAIVPSGNTNLVATDVGFGRRGVAALDALEREGRSLRKQARSPIRVCWPDGSRAPLLGMFMGANAFSRAIAVAHSPHVLKYAPHDLAVVATVLGVAGHLALNARLRRAWRQGEAFRLGIDGAAPGAERSFLFLASALNTLQYGAWPFWCASDAPEDGVHFLNIHAEPEQLLRGLSGLVRGRPPVWMQNSPDYRSGRATLLRIDTAGDFVLDGEVLDTGPDRAITLAPGPRFSFLQAVS